MLSRMSSDEQHSASAPLTALIGRLFLNVSTSQQLLIRDVLCGHPVFFGQVGMLGARLT